MDDVPWDEVAGIEVLTAGYQLGVLAYTPKVIQMWDTLEDHTVTFRGSPEFSRWRELAGPHFAKPPQVRHVQLAVRTNGNSG